MFAAGITTAVAAGLVQTITAELRPDYTIIIDGQAQTFADANGNTVYPISYNGTTYLPLRAVGGLMGKEVGWDGATNTVTLQEPAQSSITLSQGQYIVGEDIAAGKYNVSVVSGSGNFQGEVAGAGMFGMLNEIMAETGDVIWGDDRSTYSNLRLANGDNFTINSGLVLKFDLVD